MYVFCRRFDVFALYSREKIKYRMSKWCPAYSFIFHQGLTIKMFPFQKKKGKEAILENKDRKCPGNWRVKNEEWHAKSAGQP